MRGSLDERVNVYRRHADLKKDAAKGIKAMLKDLKSVEKKSMALTLLRGFARENSDFEIFLSAKRLICQGLDLRFGLKTAVVKTYPIPKRGMVRIDSSHHVSATHGAKEERQDARLLERGREQASR
jgi:hypothetical protein